MKIRKLFHLMLTSVLGMLGCSEITADEYGCPTADFEMKGKVTNEKGEALPDVEVSTSMMEKDSIVHYRRLSTTGETGTYQFKEDLIGLGWKDGGYSFSFIGDTTLYETYDTVIPADQIHLKGGDGKWYEGKASLTVDVVLKDKK